LYIPLPGLDLDGDIDKDDSNFSFLTTGSILFFFLVTFTSFIFSFFFFQLSTLFPDFSELKINKCKKIYLIIYLFIMATLKPRKELDITPVSTFLYS